MKSKILLLLSTLFLSLPVFAVTGLPPGTQFHLSTGNVNIPTYPYIQECQGSCIYIEDVDGFPRTWAGINVGETDHISNNVTLPLNYAERIGNVSITSYVYRLMAWRGQQPDLSTVLSNQICLPFSPQVIVRMPQHLARRFRELLRSTCFATVMPMNL